MNFETLAVSLDGPVATVRLNRADKANAMNAAMWQEIRRAFEWVDATAAGPTRSSTRRAGPGIAPMRSRSG